MADGKNRNDAARSRSVKRMIKSGEGIDHAFRELDSISDPYFRSLSYLYIFLGIHEAKDKRSGLLERCLEESVSVEKEWRRAELWSLIMKDVSRCDPVFHEASEVFILESVDGMRSGQGRSDAVTGISSYVSRKRLKDLLGMALENRGFEKDDSKAVIRSIKKRGLLEKMKKELLDLIGDVEDKKLKIHLLGYLHLQGRKSREEEIGNEALEEALRVLSTLDGFEAVQLFGYLCRNTKDAEDLHLLEKGVQSFEDPGNVIRALGDLSTACDRVNRHDDAIDHLVEAEEISKGLGSAEKRAAARSLIASGLERLGEKKRSLDLFREALADADGEPSASRKVKKRMERAGFGEKREKRTEQAIKETGKGPRDVLGLYDTYEGGLKPIHSRTVARAAPLCWAFDLDMALFGFPVGQKERIVELASKDTNIGKGGIYVTRLDENGRLIKIDCTERVPPGNWSGIGLPVATTSQPDPKKKIGLKEVVKIARDQHPLGRICLIMGLGKRGLPGSLLNEVPYHLEITGMNVPLETATAMGILAYMLHEI